MALRPDEEVDDGYTRESFERVEEDTGEDPEQEFEDDWERACVHFGLDESFEYSREAQERYVKEYRADTRQAEDDRRAAAKFEEICINVLAYDAELCRLEIPPNGSDYNAVLFLIAGHPLVLPTAEDR